MKRMTLIAATVAAATIAWTSVWGGDYVWNNTGDNWFDAANWDGPAGYPGDGDTATIGSGGILLTNETGYLSAFTCSGGSVTFTNWSTRLRATTILLNGGTITHAGNSDTNGADGWTPDARVWLVCSNLTMAAGAVIDLDGKGWRGGSGSPGHGPGGGVIAQYSGAGGGHGGYGGAGYSGGFGAIYDSIEAPALPGSGGGSGPPSMGGIGGAGGGVVRIDAHGHVALDGTITANGKAYVAARGAGGSGGAVSIACRTCGGSGIVQARGGAGGSIRSGGGGGGRIALSYDTSAQALLPAPLLQLSVKHGAGGVSDYGEMGTIHLPDTALLRSTANVYGEVYGVRAWATNALVVSNMWVRFAEEGFVLDVDGDVTVTGSDGRLDVGGHTNVVLFGMRREWYVDGSVMTSAPSVCIAGDLVVANGGAFGIYAAQTNAFSTNWGAIVSVAGEIDLSGGSWIHAASHPINGGSPLFTAADVSVASGCGVSASAGGYAGQSVDSGAASEPGYGPGGGSSALYCACGGGYGGVGGTSSSGGSGGSTYGYSNAPAQPGSGGGFGHSGGAFRPGGYGGGLIRMELAGTLQLDGTLEADGGTAGGGGTWSGGGGSGGSVYVTCSAFSGSGGSITAKGGNAGTRSGSGGGGRVALVYARGDPSGTSFNVTNGTSAVSYHGTPGTVFLYQQLPPQGTVFLIR